MTPINALKQNKLAIDDNSLLEWSDWLRQMVVIIQVSTWKQFNINTHNTTMNESTAANNVFVGHQNLCQGVLRGMHWNSVVGANSYTSFELEICKIEMAFNYRKYIKLYKI